MKFIAFILLLLPAVCSAQKIDLPLQDSLIIYEEVVRARDTTTSADKLFSLAQTWFADSFKDSKSVLQVNDRQAHKLIGKGASLYEGAFGSTPASYITYTVAVDVKNGKYRYRIYDFGLEYGTVKQSVSTGYSHYLHDAYQRMVFESKKAAQKRYEKLFATVSDTAERLRNGLKSNMANVNADNF